MGKERQDDGIKDTEGKDKDRGNGGGELAERGEPSATTPISLGFNIYHTAAGAQQPSSGQCV